MQIVKNYKSVQNTETGIEEVTKCVPLLFCTTRLQLPIYLRIYLLACLCSLYVRYYAQRILLFRNL